MIWFSEAEDIVFRKSEDLGCFAAGLICWLSVSIILGGKKKKKKVWGFLLQKVIHWLLDGNAVPGASDPFYTLLVLFAICHIQYFLG